MRRHRMCWSGAVLLGLALSGAKGAAAAEYTVTNLSEAELRRAVLNANTNAGQDVIQFARGLTGTITLSGGPLTITDSLTIEGPGANILTVSGGGNTRIVHIPKPGITVNIRKLTFADGVAKDIWTGVSPYPLVLGGAVLNEGATLNLFGMKLVNNLALSPASPLDAIAAGGAVATIGGTLTLTDSLVTENRARGYRIGYGGGVFADREAKVNVSKSSFTGNVAKGDVFGAYGGAMALQGDTKATVTNAAFERNVAEADEADGPDNGGSGIGGGIFITTRTLFAGNPSDATLLVQDSRFYANLAIGGDGDGSGAGGLGAGGGIALLAETDGLQVTIRRSTFSDNRARGGDADGGDGGRAVGGALSNVNATLNVEDARFNGNKAVAGDGGSLDPIGNGGHAFGGTIGSYGGGSTGLKPTFVGIRISITQSEVLGGKGGEVLDGKGRPGGTGAGGAVYIDGFARLEGSTVTLSQATGGTGGRGGQNGLGFGGGIFVLPRTTAGLSGTRIADNTASTRDNDVSGPTVRTGIDPTDSSKTALFVYGTAKDDTIKVTGNGGVEADTLRVEVNGFHVGTFQVTGRVMFIGLTAGDVTALNDVALRTVRQSGSGPAQR